MPSWYVATRWSATRKRQIFSHKSGIIVVQAASAVAFVWLVRRVGEKLSPNSMFVTIVGLGAVVVGAGRNRGGMLAAGVGLVLTVVLARLGRRQLMIALTSIFGVLFLVATLAEIEIPVSESRSASVGQMIANVQSLVSPDDTGRGDLTGTADWRAQLWKEVVTGSA